MFTGLVEEVGRIESIYNGSHSCILKIKCSKVLSGTNIGDSIAVNGVCLTVTSLGRESYTADVMPETMQRSSLGTLGSGSKVNLERAMPANGRFGGHIVSGHIDGTGSIRHIQMDDNAVIYTIMADASILKYIVEKGSITIDGISLTVTYVDDEGFQVSTIPHTREGTNLLDRKTGDLVNLECDIIGKYVEKLLKPTGQNFFENKMPEENNTKSKITEEFLREHGF